MTRPGAIAFYPRGAAAFSFLFAEIAARRPLKGFWPADGLDMLRWAAGLAPQDAIAPIPVPKSLLVHNGGLLDTVLGGAAKKADTVFFTRPDQAPLLPRFQQQKKVFYVVDDYQHYNRPWEAQEMQLLQRCDHIVCISDALAAILRQREPASAGKLFVSTNAFPAAWIPAACPTAPAPLPEGLRLPRPVAGVLGTVSSRLRLDVLLETARHLPGLHWLFAGGVEDAELQGHDRPILAALQAQPNCTFLGTRSYAQLAAIAAALDVAVMPYSNASTNPAGSPMRLYMHLPTPGCLAVTDYQPLVRMCDSAAALIAALEDLQRRNFDDGLGHARWEESRRNSWAVRAEKLLAQLG
jgi:glycosyltransferase involved in cell wall biosynthesis